MPLPITLDPRAALIGPRVVYRYFDSETHARALCRHGVIFLNTVESWATAKPPRGDRLEGIKESLHIGIGHISHGRFFGDPASEAAFERTQELGIISIGTGANNFIFGHNTFRQVATPKCWGLSCAIERWEEALAIERGTPWCVSIHRFPSFAFHLADAVVRAQSCHTWSRWGLVTYGDPWENKSSIDSLFHKAANSFASEREFRLIIVPGKLGDTGMAHRTDMDVSPIVIRVPAIARLCSPVNFSL